MLGFYIVYTPISCLSPHRGEEKDDTLRLLTNVAIKVKRLTYDYKT